MKTAAFIIALIIIGCMVGDNMVFAEHIPQIGSTNLDRDHQDSIARAAESSWEKLIDEYRNKDIECPDLKAITLSQWILESGRGTSDKAKYYFNFAGLKFREPPCEEKVIIDGEEWCVFSSESDFIDGYWNFIDREIYENWRDYCHDPEGFVTHIKDCGYSEDPNYVAEVLENLDEAENLLAGESTEPGTGGGGDGGSGGCFISLD